MILSVNLGCQIRIDKRLAYALILADALQQQDPRVRHYLLHAPTSNALAHDMAIDVLRF